MLYMHYTNSKGRVCLSTKREQTRCGMCSYRIYKTLTLKFYNGAISEDVYLTGLKSLGLTATDLNEYHVVLGDELTEAANSFLKELREGAR